MIMPVNETVVYLTINNNYTNGIGVMFIIIGIFLFVTLLALQHQDMPGEDPEFE